MTGPYGNSSATTADMTLDDQGQVYVNAGAERGAYSGRGVAFRAPSGWDIDADLHSGIGHVLHVHGHLPC